MRAIPRFLLVLIATLAVWGLVSQPAVQALPVSHSDAVEYVHAPSGIVPESSADTPLRALPTTDARAAMGQPVSPWHFGVAANTSTALVKYDADFALGQLTQGGRATASQLDEFGSAQGWFRSQTATGPIKYIDENGIVRLTIKQGTPRAPGSAGPHVEIRNADGLRIDPYGNPVTRKSPGNHTLIDWDW